MPEPPAIPSSWLKEEVYCASLSIEHISKHCSHCFSTLTNLRRCATCKVSHYCRPECQKSDWGVHSAECAAFARTESVCDDGMRLVMRMSKLYAKTIRRSSEEDMKACTFDEQKRYPIRGILALDDHFEQQKEKADQWIVEYQKFFGSLPVSVDVTKRLFAMANINSFGVTNEHGRVIGVAMCLGLSALNHSCKPTARIAFRGRTALIVPCDPAHIASSSNTCHSYIDNLLIRSERKRLLKESYFFDCECEGCVDEERTALMEGWSCLNCKESVAPRENAKCQHCGLVVDDAQREAVMLAVESMKAANHALLRPLSVETTKQLAHRLLLMADGSLHQHHVLRLPSLRSLFRIYMKEETDRAIQYGKECLEIMEKFQGPDDLSIVYHKWALAQAMLTSISYWREGVQMSTSILPIIYKMFGEDSHLYTTICVASKATQPLLNQ